MLAESIMQRITSTPGVLVALVCLMAAFFLLIPYLLIKNCYLRGSCNQVLVIFGKLPNGEALKAVHGGGAFVWPLVQDYRFLSLEPIQVDVPLRNIRTADEGRADVPCVFTVAIGTQPAVMKTAAERLLDYSSPQIQHQAVNLITSEMKKLLATLKIEDVKRDTDDFLRRSQESIEPELKKIGLVLINMHIVDICYEPKSTGVTELGR